MPTPIVVPKLNENDDEVVVVELADGYVEPGQPLFSVETSKAVQEVEAEAAGFVLWAAQVGDRVGVLAEMGWLFPTEEERDAWSPERKPVAAEAAAAGERLATEPARQTGGGAGRLGRRRPGGRDRPRERRPRVRSRGSGRAGAALRRTVSGPPVGRVA